MLNPSVQLNDNQTAPQSGSDLLQKAKNYLQEKQPQPPAAATAPPPAVASVRGVNNIADALYMKGMMSEDDIKKVKFESVTSNQSVEQIIISKNIVSLDQIQQVKSEMYGINYIDLNAINVDPNALAKLPKDLAQKNLAVVFEETNLKFKVAMADPLDLQKAKYIESVLRKPIEAYYASIDGINRVIETKYGTQVGAEVDAALEDSSVVNITSNLKVEDLASTNLGSAPVAKIVNMVLEYAINHHASDVHIEPREGRIAVRYRIHGILDEKLSLPAKLAPQVVTRIKILANMKIDEHRIPQDNRFQVKINEQSVDIRVSVMPSIYGEKVVMRLLEKDRGVAKLEDTGMRGPAYKLYRQALTKTQGIILVTGPTGSGKTVTLSSSLAVLNTKEVNIVTIEDPVEIRIEGVTQVQVNADVGLTFATGLRSFLRQDPDIVMVGEIRDTETADLAVQAALIGRLVLSTLHTNSAAGALPRLLDMGIEPFLLASTINVVVGQRLVRRLCDECKQEVDADVATMEMLHERLDSLKSFNLKKGAASIHFDTTTKTCKIYKPKGCPKCGDTGYQGRIGIFEVMPISDKISKMIMERSADSDIANQARSEGMISMMQDGFMKALEGITTIEEVIRVQND